MSKMNKPIVLFLTVVSAFYLSGCGNSDKTDESESTEAAKTEEVKSDVGSETFFQVPSPGEMLTFIKMVGGQNNKNVSFLNPASNQKNYSDSKSKALNFGIYSCDLSYCSIFEIGAEALKYFKVVKVLGDQIGVSTAIKPELLKRIETNISVPESLAIITDDVYFSSFEALEDGKQGPTLALVVAGGWLESIYIAVNLAKYEANSPIVERLADQKYTLENLIEYLKKHEADQGVAGVKADFESLLAIFNSIKEQEAKKTVKNKNPKEATLEGGTELVMTKDNFLSIVEKINTIRNSYTLTK
jgi:hypothetical protein